MMATDALRASPDGAIKIFRYWTVTQPLTDPAAHAAQLIQALGGYHHDLLYVELYNEVDQDRPALDDYITWTDLATQFLHAAGYKVAGFSFSTGNPTVYPDAWLYLQSRNYGGVDAVAMHEYWNGKTGEFTEWNALRHRQVHTWTNGQHPPFLITECGADSVEGGASGWKLCGISPDQYVSQLYRYDQEISRDDYVLGAAVFGGSPAPDWLNFSTDELSTGAFNGPLPRTSWSPNPAPLEDGLSIEELAIALNGPAVNPKADPSGIWQEKGVMPLGNGEREAFLDTPDWRLLHEVGGEAVELQVVQNRPN